MGLMLTPVTGPKNQADTGTLTVNIQNLEVARGDVYIAVYDKEEDFMETEKSVAGKSVPITSKGPLTIPLGRFAYGYYAIAVFHDLNQNGKLDRNALGIPKEPYAFSNNPRVKWSPPSFQESRFELRQPALSLNMELKRWGEQ